MNFKGPLTFTLRLLFPRGSKNTVGNKSILGAVVCIALSVIPLVCVINCGDAMIEGIMDRLVNLSSSHIQAICGSNGDNSNRIDVNELRQWSKILEQKVDKVTASYPVIEGNVLAASKTARTGAHLRAMDSKVFLTNKNYAKYFKVLSKQENEDSSKIPKAFIGKEIAASLNLKPGDNFTLITTKKSGAMVLPKITVFKVDRIISCGYQELDSLWVVVPLEAAAGIFTYDNSKTGIFIETENAFDKNLWKVQNCVEDILDYNFIVTRWDEINRSQYENFISTKLLLLFILILIVAVACVNISSCLVMLVMERSKEIAILKSTGTTNRQITLSFLAASLVIGFAGVVTGVFLGICASAAINELTAFFEIIINFFVQIVYLIRNGSLQDFTRFQIFDTNYYLEEIPVCIRWPQMFAIIAGTLLLSVLAGLVPSVKAGKQRLIDIFSKAGT